MEESSLAAESQPKEVEFLIPNVVFVICLCAMIMVVVNPGC